MAKNVRPHEPLKMTELAIDAMNRDAIQQDRFDAMIVYVFSPQIAKFVATIACDVTCPECGRRYMDVVKGVRAMWWDDDHGNPGLPMLVCDCGEQFTTRLE